MLLCSNLYPGIIIDALAGSVRSATSGGAVNRRFQEWGHSHPLVRWSAVLGLAGAAVRADEDHHHLARLRTFISPGMARSVLHHCITGT